MLKGITGLGALLCHRDRGAKQDASTCFGHRSPRVFFLLTQARLAAWVPLPGLPVLGTESGCGGETEACCHLGGCEVASLRQVSAGNEEIQGRECV